MAPTTRDRESAAEAIRRLAPPAPRCFEDHSDWLAWLVEAQRSGVRLLTRVPRGHGSRWDSVSLADQHCADCEPSYQARMLAAGRCGRGPEALPAGLDADDGRFTRRVIWAVTSAVA